MKFALLCVLIVQCIHETSFKLTSTTLRQIDRINILREKINAEIREKTKSLLPVDVEDSSLEALEYEQNGNLPITPIMDIDERKKNEKLKLRAFKTVNYDTTQNGGTTGTSHSSFIPLRSHKNIRKKRVHIKKPLDIFYRRSYDRELLDINSEWVHCQDIISPFLTGAKLNISNPKRLSAKDPTVIRFISLLNVNTSTYSREDIYSILYQISNLNLRLFQWEVVPLNILLNVIIKEKKHTFVNLKNGLHELFLNWRLDFTNTSTLLKQTRIFRPPCVHITTLDDDSMECHMNINSEEFYRSLRKVFARLHSDRSKCVLRTKVHADEVAGSTKSPKITKYPKKLQITTPCEDEDDC